MASDPVRVQQPIRFGDGYELDLRLRRLHRGRHVIKLERIPVDILVLLIEHKDEIVTREEIAASVWGKGVFLDTDNSIRSAIRKLRQALKDDAESSTIHPDRDRTGLSLHRASHSSRRRTSDGRTEP